MNTPSLLPGEMNLADVSPAIPEPLAILPVNGPTASPYIDSRWHTYAADLYKSLYMKPMRAWLETPDVMVLRQCAGINLNIDGNPNWDACVAGIAAYGISQVRLTSMSWGSLNPSTETFASEAELLRRLGLLAKHKIRPTVLLEINEANPSPNFGRLAWLTKPAQAGDTTIYLPPDGVAGLAPRRSGLSYINPANYRMCEVLFTDIQADGTIKLSIPLPVPLVVGTPYACHTFLYEPFCWKDADGQVAPAALASLAGYTKYVSYVCRLLHLGTGGNDWDLEFLNERFGEAFLNASNYYAPDQDPTPVKSPTLSDVGAMVALCQQAGDFARLPALFAAKESEYRAANQDFNADLLRAVIAITDTYPGADGERGAGTLNGYASQMPWIGGENNIPDVAGDTSHPYHNPQLVDSPPPDQWVGYTYILADGGTDGVKADPNNEFYTGIKLPKIAFNLPERELMRADLESRVRDLSPLPTEIAGALHGRNVLPRGGGKRAAHLVLTEFNLAPAALDKNGAWINGLGDAAVQYIHQKIVLRTFTAYANKSNGTTPVFFYAMQDDSEFGWRSMFPPNWDGKSVAGKMLPWKRSLSFVEREHGGSIQTPRPLTVTEISDNHNAVQWAEIDARHPALFCREDVIVLPFQQSDSGWIVGMYLMTYNVGQVYDPTGDNNDPATYIMPPLKFTIRLSEPNLTLKAGAMLQFYDPIENKRYSVEAIMDGADVLLVDVPLVDYPRWLAVQG